MKRLIHILAVIIALGSLFSCEPEENRESLVMTYTESTLSYSAVLNTNTLVLTNNDKDVIPYWTVTNSSGVELATFNTSSAELSLPFAGTYTVNYIAHTKGGAIWTAPKTITVLANDPTVFGDPKWNLLTNGVTGKTWILKMVAPLEFVGTNYVNSTVGGDWNWYPNFTDIGWAGIEDKDWGEITFNINGGINTTVTQTSLTTGSTEKTTTTGTFTFQRTDDFTNDRILFNGGLEMLHPGPANSWSSSFTFSNVRLVELTATTLSYTAIRADGQVLVYHLIVKPATN